MDDAGDLNQPSSNLAELVKSLALSVDHGRPNSGLSSLSCNILRTLKTRAALATLVESGKAEDLLRSLKACLRSSGLARKLSLQVAYNVVALDSSNATLLWILFKKDLPTLVRSPDCTEEASLIIHICARNSAISVDDEDLSAIFEAVSGSVSCDEAKLAIESLALIANVYESLCPDSRVVALDCMRTLHMECKNDGASPALCEFLEKMSRRFDVLVTSIVLNSKSHPDPSEVRELIATLDFLGSASALEELRPHLQKPFLVVCAASFLKALHMSQGSSARNPVPFSDPPVETMDAIEMVRRGVHASGITDAPSFEVKQMLLKLIGNLAYRNQTCQDLVRESGGLVPLLNSCRMDARNPYSMQWAILAIRNMCEGNPENQKMIESLKNEGLAPGARSVLDQFSAEGDKLGEAVLRITKK